MVQINLGIRFVVELVAVGIFAYWAWSVAGPGLPGWVAAGVAIAVFVAVWGLFLAPTADRGLSRTQKDALGTVVLLLAAGALAATGQTTGTAVYAVVVLVNIALLFVLRDDVARVLGDPGRH
jgi:Protein of unknown function (DUF2568)